MSRHSWWRWVLLISTAVLCITSSAKAHGGGELVLLNVPIDELRMSVWQNPLTPRTNEVIHITVGLTDAQRSPVLDGEVLLTVTENGRLLQQAEATTAQSVNRLFYEADLTPLPRGEYEVAVMATVGQMTGSDSFVMNVRPATYIREILWGVGIAFILLIGVLYRRSMKERPLPARRRSSRSVS